MVERVHTCAAAIEDQRLLATFPADYITLLLNNVQGPFKFVLGRFVESKLEESTLFSIFTTLYLRNSYIEIDSGVSSYFSENRSNANSNALRSPLRFKAILLTNEVT